MDTQGNEVVYLHLDDIIPNRFQPRQVFDEKALKELAVSIKEHGVIQPIIVRNIGNKYEIIAGERRYKASAMAGLTTIPAIVRNLDDKESSKVALLENLQRKNLNPIEEAKTYQKILELDQMTQEELAKTMGKSQGAVANKLRLLSLTDEVQDALLKEQISERHARALLNTKDPNLQKQLLKEIINNKMTVKELEEKLRPKEELSTNIDTNTNIPLNNNITPINIGTKQIDQTPNNQFNFNQSSGIDYSTPPKFIDYGVPDINNNLESTADKPIDLDALKDQAKDINVIEEKPNIDAFFKATPKEEEKETPPSTFKFFATEPETKEDNNNQEETSSSSIFQNIPTPIQTPTGATTSSIPVDPFALNEETKNINDDTSTSMDKLLAGVEKKEENNVSKMTTFDNFNNPFANNPIFKDNIEQPKTNVDNDKPKYTLNESINMIREKIKEIEASGFKTEVEEMDFANNYQIVIKIAKENQ